MRTSKRKKITSKAQFHNEVKEALVHSRQVAIEMKNNFIAIEHLFLGMLNTPDAKFLSQIHTDWDQLKKELYVLVQKKYPPQETDWTKELPLTDSAESTLVLAILECHLSQRRIITTQDLFLAVLSKRSEVIKALSPRGINYNRIFAALIGKKTKYPNTIIYKYPLPITDMLYYTIKRFYYQYIK